MTTTTTKNVVKFVAKSIVKKAASWKQVAKQLSGLTGNIMLPNDKEIGINQALCLLGVHVKGTVVTAKDLQLAWSERLKEKKSQFEGEDRPTGANDNWRCPLIARPLAATLQVGANDKVYKAYTYDKKASEYTPIKVQTLCRVVKGEAKSRPTDVVVSAKAVLDGLVQSIYVDDTLKEVAETQKKWENMKSCYINVGNATNPAWRAVEIDGSGVWHFVEATTKAKATTK